MTLFNNGSEMANLVVSSGLLRQSWTANSNLYRNADQNERLRYQVFQQDKYNILAFVTSPWTLEGDEAALVSSSTLKETFPLFEFLCSKANPSFAINKATISLFASYNHQLSELKSQLCQGPPYKPLIITGHSLGGSIASLFTLWMLNSMDLSKTKHPLCITFGSPLIGDSCLQKAVYQSQTWHSCFLHVVSNEDQVPRIFIHHNLALEENVYKPFGTFLICSESGCACFEDSNSILELLAATSSHGARNQDPSQVMPSVDYRQLVENLYHRTFWKDATELGDWAREPFQAGIVKQLTAIGVPQSQQQQKNIDIKHLIKTMKNRELKLRIAEKFSPSKKLNETRMYMTYLEWYKKLSKDKEIGFYDMYKNKEFEYDIQVESFKKSLTNYWINMVEELEKKPQKEEALYASRLLFSGTAYRRMVEPLDIADFYKENGLNYETQGRSEHYIRLEQWMNEFGKSEINSNNSKRELVDSILTVDSCFWAKVEEAIILCNLLKKKETSVEEKGTSRNKLKGFENYVWGLLKNYQVSPEIFLRESSFMKWWKDYKKTMGSSFTSPLEDFMKHGAYKQYANGTWSPPISTARH